MVHVTTHLDSPQFPIKVLAVETAQVYFVARGPGNKDETDTNQKYGHLAGPRVTQGDKRYLLPDPTSLTTAPYGTKVPFINSQDSGLKKYTNLNPDAWLGVRFETSDAEPPATERESTAELSFAASNGGDSASDAESLSDAESTESTRDANHNMGRTRAGRRIVSSSRLGY